MEKASILVVDDDQAIRESLNNLLVGRGYEVFTAEDGYQAIKAAQEKEWDVAMVDLKMPGIDGLEVLKEFTRISPNTRVIIVTGYATVESAVEAMKQGAVDYIAKPFTVDELLIRLEKTLENVRLIHENIYLREQLNERYKFNNILGKSDAMQDIFRLIEKVAPTDSTILIRGESGTGKELIARAIHHHSLRRNEKFIAVDCGSLPETLLESELFGHVKGSFTGAVVTKRGLLEVANNGTFFLDEVGDLSIGIQSKLLRVLQEKEFRQVGGIKNIKVDVRVIAATNRNLEQLIDRGSFREDLFYRINIVPIFLPPLRERKEDIPLLVDHFLESYNRKRKKHIKGISSDAMSTLMDFEWPGNVRELEHTIERLVIMNEGDVIEAEKLPIQLTGERVCFNITTPKTNKELKKIRKQMREKAVENVERAFIIEALKKNQWNVSKTAREVGLKRQNLQAMMRKYNVKSNTRD
jgi:DNA-binding NtrC family response regulator